MLDPGERARLEMIERRLGAIEAHLGIEPGAAGHVLPDGRLAPPPAPEVMTAIEEGNALQAIMLYRRQTGFEVSDAKFVVDSLRGS